MLSICIPYILRDLGEHLREKITSSFTHGETTQVNEEDCHRIYASLNRIASNVYGSK